MNPWIFFLAAVALLAVVVFATVWLLRLKIYMVDQEERLVIYRWGRFHRIAGPGPVLVIHAFQFETVMRTISVREQTRNFLISGLFSFDIPFGYTLNLWYRYDPVVASQGNGARLRELAQYGEEERYSHISVKLREALVRAVMTVQIETKNRKERELAVTLQEGSASKQNIERNLTIVDKLMMIVPGLPTCERILQLVQEELAHALPSIGIILNRNHPITVVGLEISDDLMLSFSRGRITELLRSTYPSLSEGELAHRVAVIEGLVDSYAFEGEQSTRVQPELRRRGDHMETRFKARPQRDSQGYPGAYMDDDEIDEWSREEASEKSEANKATPRSGSSAQPFETDWHLSERDLEVLKLVPSMPQNDGQQRRTG